MKTHIWFYAAIVIIVGAMGYQFGRAWVEPNPSLPAPQGNIGAPVNTGPVAQVKTGALQTSALKTYGLQIPTSAQDGFVLTSDADGNATWEAPSDGLDYTCDETPLYSSVDFSDSNYGVSYKMAAYKYDSGIRDVPEACKTETGCVIRKKLYNKKGLYRDKYFEYTQDTSNNQWWSSYNTSGAWKNGDSKTSNIFSPAGYQFLRDDFYKANAAYTKENNADKWTFIDYHAGYGMEVFICYFEGSPDEE